MKHHAKASHGGSTSGGGLRAIFGLALAVAAFLAIPASPAFAEIVVNLDGTGTGTVSSSPAGIECSNESIREEQGAEVLALPDCMALEMVSPSQQQSRSLVAGVSA